MDAAASRRRLGRVVIAVAVAFVAALGVSCWKWGHALAPALARRDLREHGGTRLVFGADFERGVERRVEACALRAEGALEAAGARDVSVSLERRGLASTARLAFGALADSSQVVGALRGEAGCAALEFAPASGELRLRAGAELPSALARETADTVAHRLAAIAVSFVPPSFVGTQLVLDLPVGADLERVRRLAARGGALEFKFCDDGSEYMKRLVAIAERRAAEFPGLAIQHDSWHAFGDSSSHQDLYLRDRDRAELDRFVASLAPEDAPPADRALAFESMMVYDDDGEARGVRAWRTYLVGRRAVLSGEFVRDAEVEWDESTRRPEVALTFDRAGATLFEHATRANVGRKLAIILDGTISSAPVIESAIAGGKARITLGGAADPARLAQDAKDLVAVLRAGALPLDLDLASQQIVAPAK
jgi:preprotein translocase subunit SecD